MKTTSSLVAISYFFSSAVASLPLSIKPGTVSESEYVDVVASNLEWTFERDDVDDWALSLILEHEDFGFNEIGESLLSITLNGVCSGKSCDALFAVSFGDDLFLPLQTGEGIPCPTTIPLMSGDASHVHMPPSFFQTIDENSANTPLDDAEMTPMSVTFELVNNYSDNTLSIRFNDQECEVKVNGEALPADQDLALHVMPTRKGEIMQINQIEVDGQNIGSEDERAYAAGVGTAIASATGSFLWDIGTNVVSGLAWECAKSRFGWSDTELC